MSSQPPFGDPEGPQPTEEEMRAAYEEQLKALRVEDVVVETIVCLLNLGGRKAGLVPGAEDEADAEQVRIAVEGVRALLPLVEAPLGKARASARGARAAAAGLRAAGRPGRHRRCARRLGRPPRRRTITEAPGPAQSSGRLLGPRPVTQAEHPPSGFRVHDCRPLAGPGGVGARARSSRCRSHGCPPWLRHEPL